MAYQLINTRTGEVLHTVNQRAARRLQLAERRANRRDFERRYGSKRQHPYGIVPSARPSRARRPGRQTSLAVEVGTLVALVVVGYVGVAILYTMM